MNYTQQFTSGVRVANFSDINLPLEYQLTFDLQEAEFIIKKILRHADLPYVFLVSEKQWESVQPVLSRLSATRSSCYPHALFLAGDTDFFSHTPDEPNKPDAPNIIDDTHLEIIPCPGEAGETLKTRIEAWATMKFKGDDSLLTLENKAPLPDRTDVFIVGAGITGIYAANRLKRTPLSFCVVDKGDKIGGIWSQYANASSRVNTSEGGYRLIEKKVRTNRDHCATREILADLATLGSQFSDRIYLKTAVEKIEKISDGYRIRVNRGGQIQTVESRGIILAINDRVGEPRQIQFENQSAFQGTIVSGISNNTRGLDWKDKNVVIVGMGAFAIENARTALEWGARHVTLVCRKHGTICPKIIDYLNFATPYDAEFKHDRKSNFRNMMYWKKLYEKSGATQPECWMGKIKHSGHTISVSDIWFVGHYLKKISTVQGQITRVLENAVVVNHDQTLTADIIVNCVGFERNGSIAKSLCGYNEVYTHNYVDKDFMYLADAYIDDDAFNSFFGSSVLEMVKFYLEMYILYFDNIDDQAMEEVPGIYKIPMEDRKWSAYIEAAESLVKQDPRLYAIAGKQVSKRTDNFLEKHDLKTYIAENKREWIDLHSMLAGKPMREEDCLPYVFETLLPKPKDSMPG